MLVGDEEEVWVFGLQLNLVFQDVVVMFQVQSIGWMYVGENVVRKYVGNGVEDLGKQYLQWIQDLLQQLKQQCYDWVYLDIGDDVGNDQCYYDEKVEWFDV